MRIRLAIFCLIASGLGFGQALAPSPMNVDRNGFPATGLVTVCATNPGRGTCTSLVTTYTDATLTQACIGTGEALSGQPSWRPPGVACSNPGNADADGNVLVFAKPGNYWCQYNSTGIAHSLPCSTGGGGSAPGGSNSQIQFNKSGVLQGLSNVVVGSALFVSGGVTDNTAAANTLIAAIGSTPTTILIPETYLFGAVSFPANVTLDFSAGGMLKCTNATTTTILGGISNTGLRQIFTNCLGGQGTIDFTGGTAVTEIYPEWWGASPAASAATNTPAIQAAIWGAFGCGPVACRTTASGLSEYNRRLFFSGQYHINDELKLYHVNSFTIKGLGMLRSGIYQDAVNKRIFDGQNVSYGSVDNLVFFANAAQDVTHPLLDIGADGSQGVDGNVQFITFNSVLFHGNSVGNIGVIIDKAGENNGNNIGFYNCVGVGFLTAAAQLGANGVLVPNALDNVWSGGDINSSPGYGLLSYGGQWIVRDSTFENATGGILTQTGFDVYCHSTQSMPCSLENVRTESPHMAAGNYIIIRNSSTASNFATNWDTGNLAGTAGSLNQVVTGNGQSGNGVWYTVTVAGTWGGLNTTSATSGSATTITVSGATWTINQWTGNQVSILSGTGSGCFGIASSNTATTITVPLWKTNIPIQSHRYPVNCTPDNTSTFDVEPNWGTQTTSGSVTFAEAPGYVVDGDPFTNSSPAPDVDIQNSSFYGKFNAWGRFRDVIVSRPDWMTTTAIQGQFESLGQNRGEMTNVRGYLSAAGSRLYQATGSSFNLTTPGWYSGITQWNITGPNVWSCSNAYGGGVPCNDVWIGGRSDPGATSNTSRNVLEFGGVLGRASPVGTDKNGSTTIIQGGLPTGAGTPGNIEFWEAPGGGGSSSTPQAGAVVASVTPTGVTTTGQFTSTEATGTAPLVITSTTPVANLSLGGGAGTSVKTATYTTDTNCAAVGSAANPSIAACGSAAAGSFSCATNASTGTCVVNTTAVTANSEIFITQRSDTTTGTRLGVTCNATLTTAIPEITAVTAATSFTVNLGTITTNPECFSYMIVN